MAEACPRGNINGSIRSPRNLLAPAEACVNGCYSQSASVAPSLQPHATTVEQKDEIRGFRCSRRQTFRSPLKLSLWSWFKAIFNREKLLREIEDSMQVVSCDDPQNEISEPGFIVNVLVSEKSNSTQYVETRCLLDTGCLSGNLVTRELVERLGYLDTDLIQPTPAECRGGYTLTGEPFAIEAAILLSWHHTSSSIIYRNMRFLIITSSQFEMILGSDTISTYTLLTPPVFSISKVGIRDELHEDTAQLDPKFEFGKKDNEILTDENWIKQEQKRDEDQRDTEKLKDLQKGLTKKRCERKILQHRIDAQKARKDRPLDAKRADSLAKKEKEEWNTAHPLNKITIDLSANVNRNVQKTLKSTKKLSLKRGTRHSK